MYYASGNYEAFARPKKPEGVDQKSAYIVGSGLAALTAACYLVRDGQMKGEHVHILEKEQLAGGACDGWKFENVGYVMRGGREMDNHFEVMWDLFRSIPSIETLAGVYKPRAKIEESSLPAALVRYLSEHPHIRRVVLRLDNDATGRIAAETIKTLLPRKYAVTVDIQPPPQGKDYNDCLCMRLGLPITKRRERSKER